MKLVYRVQTSHLTDVKTQTQREEVLCPNRFLSLAFDIEEVNPMSNWCWQVIHAIISGILNISYTCVQGLSHLKSNCFKLPSIIDLFSVLKIKGVVFGRVTSEISQVLVEGTRGNV